MKLSYELQNEAREGNSFDAAKNTFEEALKRCFRKNNFQPIRINFCGRQLWLADTWIDAPTCMKYDVINYLGNEGFIVENHFTCEKVEHIIVKLF